ncbi:PQQ-binding-like beta-propeller repeat protein [Piscinibacter koreensis]|uniref:PQQ-binding-like beta-propeller repeat protein n=1 Tax=Piscinibacter koreensis TaxID=2742824 RepID=A0A7Y6TWI9_9BURK|nr:PQQ-binding-like beta-propeller repeat protein [Schlegelella koreensis]NUZ06062.1 PQQ-binding-like beta-propeller repeat protein [Schlegelella koreensis]
MKFNPIVSSLIAIAALTTPAVMFGAAADLNACCTPGDKDQPKVGGNLGNQSYSSLSQINKSNLNNLGPAWMTSVSAAAATTPTPAPGVPRTGQQTTPIVVDGVIYLDTPSGGVSAIDGATGVTKWKWEPTVANTGFGPTGTRRGVSVGDGKVYTTASGNRMVALDKNTGAQVWVVQPTGPGGASLGNVAKVATIYHDGMVFMSTNDGNRNSAFAMRSSDGAMVWTFYSAEPSRVVTDVNGKTVDAGASWGTNPQCALTAGAAAWVHGAVDPGTQQVFFTFGNVRSCASSQDASGRPGDNLFGDSLVALDLKTGAYKWHFQSIRHDHWDMDNVHAPVLADVQIAGQTKQAIYYGSKPAMTFILDRTNGKPLTGVVEKGRPVDSRQLSTPTQPFTAQGMWFPECVVWEPLSPNNIPGSPWRGVPNYNGYQPNARGELVYTEPNYLDVDKPFVTYPADYPREPGTPPHRLGCMYDDHWDMPVLSMTSQNGGADWSTHGYSPRTNMVYIPYGVALVAHDRGESSNGLRAPGEYQSGGIIALNASTGEVAWRNHLGLDAAHGQGPLITAGDIVFVGQPDGLFYALDAVTGKSLWKFQTGASIGAAPVTYTVGSDQYVAILSEGDKLWAFKLGGTFKHPVTGSSEAPTPAPFQVRRTVNTTMTEGATVNNTVYLARANRTADTAGSADTVTTASMNPTNMRVPVGTTVTFLNPGSATFPNFPNTKAHCATQFFEGLFNPKLNPGQSFQYTFTKEGEYWFNDCTDPRPTGRVIVYAVPQNVPGALSFIPSTLNMRPANGVFTSVQGLVTATFKVPAGYTLDGNGNVQLKTPLSTTLFPAVNATVSGSTLLVTFDKSLIDNNIPAGTSVPLTVSANFMNNGQQKQLVSTANVQVIK